MESIHAALWTAWAVSALAAAVATGAFWLRRKHPVIAVRLPWATVARSVCIFLVLSAVFIAALWDFQINCLLWAALTYPPIAVVFLCSLASIAWWSAQTMAQKEKIEFASVVDPTRSSVDARTASSSVSQSIRSDISKKSKFTFLKMRDAWVNGKLQSRFVLAYVIVMFVPMIAACVIVPKAATASYYDEECYTGTTIMSLTVMFAALMFLLFLIRYIVIMCNSNDNYGIKKEIIAFTLALAFMISFYILKKVTFIEKDSQNHYGYVEFVLFAVPFLVNLVFSMIYPIYLSLTWRKNVNSEASVSNISIAPMSELKHLSSVSRRSSIRKGNKIEDFLRSPQARKVFQDFLVLEFMVDDFLFYQQVDEVKNCKDRDGLSLYNMYREVYEKFLTQDSVLDVNISSDTRARIQMHMDSKLDSYDLASMQSEFEKAQREALNFLLHATWERFEKSVFYSQWRSLSQDLP